MKQGPLSRRCFPSTPGKFGAGEEVHALDCSVTENTELFGQGLNRGIPTGLHRSNSKMAMDKSPELLCKLIIRKEQFARRTQSLHSGNKIPRVNLSPIPNPLQLY
jgi:hypothetical protein